MNSIEIKGLTFSLTTIQITSSNRDEIAYDLTQWISKAPLFFKGTSVILQLADNCEFSLEGFKNIIKSVRKNDLIPVGVFTSNKKLISLALNCGLGVFRKNANNIYENKNNQKNCKFSKSIKINEPTFCWSKTRIMNRSIRSGQQIYAKNSDLVIFGSVNPGAEVIADGNIQIYGKTRGRALAGATGETSVFVYASNFKPEMIAIAGYYKITDDIPQVALEKSVQAVLKNEKVIFVNV